MKQIEELYLNYAKTVYKYLLCLTKDKDVAEDLTWEEGMVLPQYPN